MTRIALVPGDGIGPEIIAVGKRVLETVQRIHELDLELFEISASALQYSQTGIAVTEVDYQATLDADAIYLGAIGLPHVRFADGTEINGELMVRWRRDLDLYANVRPLRSYSAIPSLYARPRDVDIIVVREGTEGLYAANGGGAMIGNRIVADPMVITRAGSERVCRTAFELARKYPPRNGIAARVTCIDKANILRGFALFRSAFDTVAAEFPDVESERLYADAASMLMTLSPERYHVVVGENLLGDIFSDLAAAYVGGLGMAPSGEIGDGKGLFQPSHGSAPTIAGQDVANPIATILSGAMMLDWLADRDGLQAFAEAARSITRAVEIALASPANHTRDLGGTAGTSACGAAVVEALQSTPVLR